MHIGIRDTSQWYGAFFAMVANSALALERVIVGPRQNAGDLHRGSRGASRSGGLQTGLVQLRQIER
jgi:hypothetical protein